MVRPPLLWLALGACDGGGPAGGQGELRLALDVETDDDVALAVLDLQIGEVVFTAEGPEGPLSVSVSSGASVRLVGGPSDALPAIELDHGTYEDVRVDLVLRGAGDAAAGLECEGLLEESEFVLTIDEVTLGGDEDDLAMGSVARMATFRLRPGEWFDGLDLEELADDEVVVLAATTHPTQFARVVENLRRSTEVSFDEAEEGDD